MTDEQRIVGRVLRASTRGFDCGAHSRNITDVHDFGAFVIAPIANDQDIFAVGVIYKVEIKDDQLISELVMGDLVPDNILRDQRDNRMIPVEVKILNVGYWINGQVIHSMPPRPPMSLSDVWSCSSEQVREFTRKFDFIRLILGASEVPSDDLIAATIRTSARHHSDPYAFTVDAGRRIARELANDLKRLSYVLSLLRS
jgi:hypothetical protein